MFDCVSASTDAMDIRQQEVTINARDVCAAGQMKFDLRRFIGRNHICGGLFLIDYTYVYGFYSCTVLMFLKCSLQETFSCD